MSNKFPWTWWLAFKLWRAKKAHSIIQIVQSISFWGIAVSSAALIIILSAFNGLEDLVTSSLKEFHASVRIEPAAGRFFHLSSLDTTVFHTSMCTGWSPVLEDMAIAQYGDHQQVVMLKGVVPERGYEETFKNLIVQGDPVLQNDSLPFAWLGIALANDLKVSLNNYSQPVVLYVPASNQLKGSTFSTDFRNMRILPAAFFSIDAKYDQLYILLPYSFAEKLFERPRRCSAIEVFAANGVSDGELKRYFHKKLGSAWIIKTRFEQEEAIFKIIKTERLMVILLLSFVVLITSFTLATTLTLTIITRNRDLSILWSFGATVRKLRELIVAEGMIITLLGLVVGLLLGTIVLLLQMHFGLVTFETTAETFMSNVYPVKMIWTDYVLVSLIVLAIGLLLSLLSARQIMERDFNLRSYAM
jgi:ABC-type lipoprotein release transport system permease subunit